MLKRRKATQMEWDGEHTQAPEEEGDLQKGYVREPLGRAYTVNTELFRWDDDQTIYPGDEQ